MQRTLHSERSIFHAQKASPHHASGGRACKHYLPHVPCPDEPCSTTHQRCGATRAAARKGFGTVLPKLPSLGGKNKPPAGGVAPLPLAELGIPEQVEHAWAEAQQQWRQRCIDQPVELPHLGAQVHLVPVGADMPGDASLIRDVVTAVQPDAIALESSPQHLKSYTSIAKALEPLLAHLLASAQPSGPAAARSCLSQAQREAWQRSLLDACRGASFKPEPEQLTHLFRLGSLPFVESLVPAHIVRTSPSSSPSSAAPTNAFLRLPKLQQLGAKGSEQSQRQQMLLVSCGLSREARAKAPAPSLLLGREFDMYLEEVEEALGEELAAELDAWRASLGDRLEAAGDDRQMATLLTTWEAQACLGPEQQRQLAARVEQRLREEARERSGTAGGELEGEGEEGAVALEVVRTPADPWVAARLVELAAGKDVVRRCRRIVAVVGRVHLLSVEEELRKLAAAAQ